MSFLPVATQANQPRTRLTAELGAPVFHRLPDRISAHARICFLALVLYRVMRMRLKANGNKQSPKTTLELLHRLQKHRVQIGKQHLTGIGKTSAEQLELFAALDIKIPA